MKTSRIALALLLVPVAGEDYRGGWVGVVQSLKKFTETN